MQSAVNLSVDEVRRVAERALIGAGVPSHHARVQCDLWMEAELRGHPSHGFLRLPRIVERIKGKVAEPSAEGKAVWVRPSLLHVDGQNGLGPVVAWHALRCASERAKQTGVAIAAVHHSNHLGMLAIYAEQIARNGQVLIALTTSEALVHPWGGRFAMLGTNPIAIGVPADPEPFVLDMATGVVSMGKIHDYAAHGRPLQEGWALDAEGNPTLDASVARSGSLAPFGDAKGYALGLAFEVLVGALTASALGCGIKGTLDSTMICNKGDVFIVIEVVDAGRLVEVSRYLGDIRASIPSDPSRPVAVPGDRARAQRAISMVEGLRVEPELWKKLCALANANDTTERE